MNTSITMPSNGDNDWGLFVDIDNNHVSTPTVTIKHLEKSKFDTIQYKKNPTNMEYCLQYMYYYWGIYIIQHVYK